MSEKSKKLDQFYTDPNVASELITHLIVLFGDTFLGSNILEPSAGQGAFTDNLKTRSIDFTALDLEPKKSYIKQQDFLTWQPNKGEEYFSIGNPPFGKNSSLAIKFFNKCAEFSTHIAFVVPNTFKKNSTKDKLNLDFHLHYEKVLPLESFIFDGEPYSVPCCFQVWVKKPQKRELTPRYFTQDFDFVKADSADIAFQRVGAKAGKITTGDEAKKKSPSSHIFIRFNNEKVKSEFMVMDFDKYKYATAGNPSISKKEILEIWSRK